MINKMVDLTYLKAGTDEEFEIFMKKAIVFNPFSVCVLPTRIEDAICMLPKNTDIKICTVIGFPSGNHTVSTKVFETGIAIRDGADEIDYVVNKEYIFNNQYSEIDNEASRIKAEAGNRIVKAIIESAELTPDQIEMVCDVLNGVVDFVKTSTGFSPKGGATAEAVRLMKKCAPDCQVKASGGIKTIEDAQKMIDAGATRIGASGLSETANTITSY